MSRLAPGCIDGEERRDDDDLPASYHSSLTPCSSDGFNEDGDSSASPVRLEKEDRTRGPSRVGFASNVRRWLRELDDRIEREGASFRSKLSENDVLDIKRARFLFHTCSILPPILYYWFTKEDGAPPKFPASISHTIRKGAPHRTQLIIWSAGWYLLSRVIRRAGSDVLKRFTTKMVCTGFVTTTVCSLGRSVVSDAVHFMAAGVYMVQHVVFLKVLNQRPVYRKWFYGSFLTLLASIAGVRRLESRTGLPSESTAHGSVRKRMEQLARLPPGLKSTIFWWELMLMVSENLLFMSFVHGMPSGLTEGKTIAEEDSRAKG